MTLWTYDDDNVFMTDPGVGITEIDATPYIVPPGTSFTIAPDSQHPLTRTAVSIPSGTQTVYYVAHIDALPANSALSIIVSFYDQYGAGLGTEFVALWPAPTTHTGKTSHFDVLSGAVYWQWDYSYTNNSGNRTISLDIQFDAITPCFANSTSVFTPVNTGAGARVDDVTSSLVPPGNTLVVDIPGLADNQTIVEIPTTGIFDITVTTTIDVAPITSEVIDLELITFTAAGVVATTTYNLANFVPSQPTTQTTVFDLLSSGTEVYWYWYIFNADDNVGHTLDVDVSWFCSTGGLFGSSTFVLPFGMAAGQGAGVKNGTIMSPLGFAFGQNRLRRGRSFVQVIR